MRLVAYNLQCKYQLSLLLREYIDEVEGECIGNTSVAIDEMLESGRHIYLLYTDDDKAIGFTIMFVNDQYGLTKPIAVNEYVYLKPKYRTSIASKYLLLQTFDYCSQLNIDVVGYTYNHSSNIHNLKLLGSDVIGTIFKVSIDLMNKKLNKIRKVK